MNLNVTFHILIHVYVSTFEAFYLTTYISAALRYIRLNRAPLFIFFHGKIFNERSVYLACILVITRRAYHRTRRRSVAKRIIITLTL